MTIYSVFEPLEERSSNAPPAVVAEKFSWAAFLVPPLFLAGHRLWRALLGYVAGVVALAGLGLVLEGDGTIFWLYVLFAISFGFEAPALRRAGLKRRGFSYQTDIVAAAADVAQVEWLKHKKAIA